MAGLEVGTLASPVPDWLPNDTEESDPQGGPRTAWHQEAIGGLAGMLREVGGLRGATWGVCEGVALVGLRYPNGEPYDPRPDVMVLAHPLPRGSMAAITLAEAGVPLFLVEMASESTVKGDLEGKWAAYAAVGVPEYLVYDPDSRLLGEPLRAWRLAGGRYVPWLAEGDGWWHSRVLDVWFGPTQPLVSVRDHDGRVLDFPEQSWRRRLLLEARLREAEQAQAAAERVRAALEERLAEAERARAALEEQLRGLQGEGDPSGPESRS